MIEIRDAKYIYFIDYENTKAEVLDDMEGVAPEGSLFLVFYSEHTRMPDKVLDSLSWDPDVWFIDCRDGSHDAMDFQITAMAGRLSALYPHARYTILSGDTGYDPAIRMLQEYGVRIFRLPDVQSTGQAAAVVSQEEAEAQKKPLRDQVQEFIEGSGTTVPAIEDGSYSILGHTTGHKKPLTETE